jgi:hypothetical protein
MVGTHATPDHTTDRVTVEAVRARLNGQSYRFVTAGKRGLSVHIADLAVLVAEIVTELTDQVTAERDALAEDLAWELNATRNGREASAKDAKGGVV